MLREMGLLIYYDAKSWSDWECTNHINYWNLVWQINLYMYTCMNTIYAILYAEYCSRHLKRLFLKVLVIYRIDTCEL